MSRSFKTIKERTEGFFKDRGSKFIGIVIPVPNKEEAMKKIEAIREEYPDARHHCFAYRIGPDGEAYRINDDGEPSGSAGQPIHGQLLSYEVTNVVAIVVRYFGGTKLGVGGLIHAYKTSIAEALDKANIFTTTIKDRVRIHFDYPDTNQVKQLLHGTDIDVLEETYDARCHYLLAIPESKTAAVIGQLEGISNLALDRSE